jgi:protein phosphatase
LQLVASTRPSIAEFVERLCDSLIKGEIQSEEKLVAVLDQGLAEVGRSGQEFGSGEPNLLHTLIIATRTDKGPSRQRNEDACYPPSGTTIEASSLLPVAIVCDGIGGHEGGNIASNLAIASIQQQIQQMPLGDILDPTTISSELERAVRVANDKISQRNDNEQRHGRQRMGTTLVMTLARTHEMYIAHVGDSRAYWITRTGCHQVTLDDNVASREVRLGYALYREALQQPSSGSLVQALGMTSTSLHPTVQRFVIDEDCVFLLCSDGLSDYERVEQCWETEILPILDGKIDVATASQRLVEIGNTQNGHDNVTVGLVYCQVKFFEPSAKLNPSLSSLLAPTASDLEDTKKPLEPANADLKLNKTQLLPSQKAIPRHLFVPVLLGIVLLVSVGGGLLTYLLKQDKRPRLTTTGSSPTEAQLPESSVTPTIEPQSFSSTLLPSLKEGELIQTKSEIVLRGIGSRPEQAITFPKGQPVSWIQGSLPGGSVLQVIKKQPTQHKTIG